MLKSLGSGLIKAMARVRTAEGGWGVRAGWTREDCIRFLCTFMTCLMNALDVGSICGFMLVTVNGCGG